MSVFNTPEAFGGGKANAKPLFEKAVALYKAGEAQTALSALGWLTGGRYASQMSIDFAFYSS